MRLPLLLGMLLLACGPAAAQTYRDYADRLEAGDTDLDYLAFRLAYAASDGYAPYDTDASKQRSRMLAALFEADDPALARTIADSVLARNATDVDGHFISMIAARDARDSLRGDFHEAVGGGLIASIGDSGDGTIPASPWHVISVDEEYAMLRYLGLHSSGQTMEECNGARCDHITVRDPAPEPGADTPSDLYFDISVPWAYLRRQVRR